MIVQLILLQFFEVRSATFLAEVVQSLISTRKRIIQPLDCQLTQIVSDPRLDDLTLPIADIKHAMLESPLLDLLGALLTDLKLLLQRGL